MPTRVEVRGHHHSTRCVLVNSVHSIVSNRLSDGEEQYLVRWESEEPLNNFSTPPLSWHSIKELRHCLEQVQDYLNTRTILSNASLKASSESKKRKCPESTDEIERRPSPLERRLQVDRHRSTSTPASRSSSVAPSLPLPSSYDVYNGILEVDKHNCIYVRSASGPHIPVMNLEAVSSRSMIISAQKSKVDTALIEIRNTYVRRLAKVQVKPIHLINLVDATTPSLRFRFVSECILDEQQGVYRASSETQQGCTQCSPNMGRSIGCEYTKKCDCLEYAAVDEARINDQATMEAYQMAMASGQSTLGFPKKFPYFAEGTKPERVGCLVPFYLNSRRPIYECNDKCGCGDHCRNKNVQFGRQVEVEIFRTQGGRGWGLKCRQDLQEGQFIDTYRGEIITDAEATRREEASTKAKASYLYSLDKFAESENIPEEDIFVVDGEFMGGPTIFLNHSCDPNCRQYTVSYNRHDPRVYDIAFFACRFIPAGEELTFDYLDKDEADEPTEESGEDAVPCLCGAKNCRKWLWT